MIGAIAGDIIGSVYEHDQIKTKDFPLFLPRCSFTDDTVLTVAIADAVLTGCPYAQAVREIGRRHTKTQCATPFHWVGTVTLSLA